MPCSAVSSLTRSRQRRRRLRSSSRTRRRRGTGSGPTARRATTSSWHASLPANVTVTAWWSKLIRGPSTTAAQALEDPPNGASRIAACWYSPTSFTVDVDLTDGQAHNLELYFLDYDNEGRSEQSSDQQCHDGGGAEYRDRVDFLDRVVYLEWAVSGNVLITITKTSPAPMPCSAVLFFDPSVEHVGVGCDSSSRTRRRRGTGSGPTALRATIDQQWQQPPRLRHRHAGWRVAYTWASDHGTQALEVPPLWGKPHRGVLVLSH